MILNALPDDFVLNAASETGFNIVSLVSTYYLTDTVGNYLTDTAGNRLIAYVAENVNAKVLHALPDDFVLNAE